MNNRIKELLELKQEIETKTNKAIQDCKLEEMELLQKAEEKIYNHYDMLLKSMDRYHTSFIFFTEEGDKLNFSFCSNSKNSPWNKDVSTYVMLTTEGFERYVLNKNCKGYCKEVTAYLTDVDKYRLARIHEHTSQLVYNTEIINLLIKYEKKIEEKLISTIEDEVKRSNFDDVRKLSEKKDLLETLNKYLEN